MLSVGRVAGRRSGGGGAPHMEPAHALGVTVAHLQDPPPPSRRAPSAQPECGLQRPGWGRPPSPCSRHPVRVPGHASRPRGSAALLVSLPASRTRRLGLGPGLTHLCPPRPARCPARSSGWACVYVAECERVPPGEQPPASRLRGAACHAPLSGCCAAWYRGCRGPGFKDKVKSSMFIALLR